MRYFHIILMILMSASLLHARVPAVSEFRAVKITNVDSEVLFSDEAIAEAMDYLASIGINTILVVVWNGSGTTGDCTLYPSRIMEEKFGIPIHPAFAGRDPLKRIIIEAHRNGMEVLPWFEMGFATSYSQDGGHIIEQYPDWALLDRNGNLVVKNGFDWMSAINPEVQNFIIELTMEVVREYDVDGIEYSDRIPAMPVEGGYDAATVERYKQDHGGADPPSDYNNSAWKRWRADQLSDFFQRVRDSVKTYDDQLIVSSSPSLYPWSYDNYLQDSKTWMEKGISDNIIPQVYRYSLDDYVFELDKSLNNFPGLKDRYYSGMLIKSGGYTIPVDFFLDAISANRERGVMGEAFFFYEGLRDNDDRLGDTLAATYYADKALVPDRNGQIRRPDPVIVNENSQHAESYGEWISYTNISGYEDGCFYAGGSSEAGIDYYFDVPFSAWYSLYIYGITHWNATERAEYVIFTDSGTDTVHIDQSDPANAGWIVLKDVFLEEGDGRKLVTLINQNDRDHLLFTDAAMIMINRKLSPDVEVPTGIENLTDPDDLSSAGFHLHQNYPNPFNPVTTIRYTVGDAVRAYGNTPKLVETHNNASQHTPPPEETHNNASQHTPPPIETHNNASLHTVHLTIHNVLGQKIATLVSGTKATGHYKTVWDGVDDNGRAVSSGIYLYKLNIGEFSEVRKMIYIK